MGPVPGKSGSRRHYQPVQKIFAYLGIPQFSWNLDLGGARLLEETMAHMRIRRIYYPVGFSNCISTTTAEIQNACNSKGSTMPCYHHTRRPSTTSLGRLCQMHAMVVSRVEPGLGECKLTRSGLWPCLVRKVTHKDQGWDMPAWMTAPGFVSLQDISSATFRPSSCSTRPGFSCPGTSPVSGSLSSNLLGPVK